MTAAADGFVIEEIRLDGFMRYLTPTVLRFPEKFTVLTGSTGAGKTTILDAITFALFKATSRTDLQTVTMADVCRPGGSVHVAFRQGGHHYEVGRGLSSKGAAYVEFRQDGEEVPGSILEVDRAIQEVIGLDYKGFLNSTFVRQEEMKELGRATASARLGIFQKLFRLETFQKAQDRAKAALTGVSGEVDRKEAELSVRREQVEELPLIVANANVMEDRVAALRKEREALGAQVTAQEALVKDREAGHEAYLKVIHSLENLGTELEGVEKRAAKARAERESIAGLKEVVQHLTEETARHDALLEEGESLRQLQTDHALAAKDVEGAKDQLRQTDAQWREKETALETQIQTEEARIASLKTALGAEESFALLRREGALSERIVRIAKEMEWLAGRKKLLSQIRQELADTESEMGQVTAKTGGITADAFVVDEIRSRVAQLRDEFQREQEAHEARLQEAKAAAVAAEDRVAAVGFGKEERARLTELRDALSALKTKRRELDDARKELDRIGDPGKLLAELEDRAKKLREEKGALESQREELKVAEVEFAAARERLEQLRAERERMGEDLSRQETEWKLTQDRIGDLQEVERKIGEVEEEAAALRSEVEVLTILKDGVFHRKGIVMYAINQLLPELEAETSRNLRDLTDGRFTRVKLETVEENRTHGIRIAVEGVDGEWHDVAEFSGGERTQINAALRFAIAKELASMPRIGRTYGRMKTLFIDEGDLGSLDTDVSRELFVHKLFKMGEFFDRIVLITHLADVADRFEGRVRVFMTPEGESRLEVVDGGAV